MCELSVLTELLSTSPQILYLIMVCVWGVMFVCVYAGMYVYVCVCVCAGNRQGQAEVWSEAHQPPQAQGTCWLLQAACLSR